MGDDRADGDADTGNGGDDTDDTETVESGDRFECDLCGDRVPEPVYREHLLKECQGW